MDIQSAIRAVTEHRDLSRDEMTSVMRTIMSGEATESQIGGFLIGLRMKGESVEEIAAAATVMRELATPVHVEAEHLVDTCGTGGDASSTFNISTASAFVAAGAGARVAKHGNRSASSSSGSADVLEAAGVNLDLTPEQIARCIEEVGVGFMFAPKHHGAMKHAIGPRKEIAVRTIFNVLGPLTNPAGAPNQVVGVFSRDLIEPLARVLAQLGSRHVLVVHSEDGLDEISIGAETHVAEARDGHVHTHTIDPSRFGMQTASLSSLSVASPRESLEKVRAVLDNADVPSLYIVALNAGAAIYASGLAGDLQAGVTAALESIANGSAGRCLAALVELSSSF
jgi:anthranilate phosphoribosyltransferase